MPAFLTLVTLSLSYRAVIARMTVTRITLKRAIMSQNAQALHQTINQTTSIDQTSSMDQTSSTDQASATDKNILAEQTLAYFDSLEPVSIDFMLGAWRGEGVHTDHPMDGLLENFNWYGKEFVSAEQVHPLVFKREDGSLVKLNPKWMQMKFARNTPLARQGWVRKAFQLATGVMKTDTSRARLRMTEYRGKVSATMIYDDQPINDVFRKIDNNSVMGVMDLKGMRQPFFFKLIRIKTPA